MKKCRHSLPILFALALCFWTGCSVSPPEKSIPATSPQRIVSTVPSITEILFDIGAGDRIVGDSAFTRFPTETENIPKIGGLYDTNIETVVSLKPDLVILLDENSPLSRQLKPFDMETLVVDHRSLEGVLESYEIIGRRLGPEILANAQNKKRLLVERIDAASQKDLSTKPVPVLLCVDRIRGTGRIQGLYAAGTNPFYEEVIKFAGGKNVATSTGLAFPTLSAEGIAELAPEVIVELFTGEGRNTVSDMDESAQREMLESARSDWKSLGIDIPAVKNDRVYLIADDYVTIPGPRTPLLIEKLAQLLSGNKKNAKEPEVK